MNSSYAVLHRPIRDFMKTAGQKATNFVSAITRHQDIIKARKKTFKYQLKMLTRVLLCIAFVSLINVEWPTFYNYPYFSWEVSVGVISGFWLLYLWGIFLWVVSYVSGNRLQSSHLNEQVLRWGLIVGNTASVWEELGYRYIFIFFASVGIMVINWLLGTVLLWALLLGMLLFAVVLFIEGGTSKVFPFLLLLGAAVCFMASGSVNPIYWVYEYIFIPVLNFVSFGSFSDIIYSGQHQPLFIMGAILANVWFRDGHKYQGWFGYLDSWSFGFVMIYATMTYGLLTALVLHSIWNTLIVLVNYAERKIIQVKA